MSPGEMDTFVQNADRRQRGPRQGGHHQGALTTSPIDNGEGPACNTFASRTGTLTTGEWPRGAGLREKRSSPGLRPLPLAMARRRMWNGDLCRADCRAMRSRSKSRGVDPSEGQLAVARMRPGTRNAVFLRVTPWRCRSSNIASTPPSWPSSSSSSPTPPKASPKWLGWFGRVDWLPPMRGMCSAAASRSIRSGRKSGRLEAHRCFLPIHLAGDAGSASRLVDGGGT